MLSYLKEDNSFVVQNAPPQMVVSNVCGAAVIKPSSPWLAAKYFIFPLKKREPCLHAKN